MPDINLDLSLESLTQYLFSEWGALALLIILIVAAFFIFRHYLKKIYEYKQTFNTILLKVQIPQMAAEQKSGQAAEGGGLTVQQLQEKIAVMETFLVTIAGLEGESGFAAWLRGRQDILSFELVINKGKISFFISCPVELQQQIEDQIHAQFSAAVISPEADYNIFTPKSVIFGKYLTFRRPYCFPIKTYKKIETDPLNALLNALGQVDDKDGAAIQIVFRPAKRAWHDMGTDLASSMQQGRKFEDAVKDINAGFFSGLGSQFWLFLKGPKKEKLTDEPQKQYMLSPMEVEVVKGLEEKTSKPGVDANIRIVASSEVSSRVEGYLNNIANVFAQYNIYQYGNAFDISDSQGKHLIKDFIYRNFEEKQKVLFNTEELSSLFHLPISSYTTHPKIDWLGTRQSSPPLDIPTEGVVIGESEYRGVKRLIRMTRDDRRRHFYCIGKTGTGKSYQMANVIIQDIQNGDGVCVMDPHGELAAQVLPYIPKERAEDVIYFDPSDMDRPMGMNMLEFEKPEQKTFVINELMNIFDKLYDLRSTGGPMFEQYFRNAVQLLMEDFDSGCTLMEVSRVLSDEDYRAFKLSKCQNPTVKNFWEKEAQKAGGEASLANMVPYITSKLTQFVANDYLRPIIAQQNSAFSFRKAMDERKIILCNLSKGKIGEMNANLLGMVIVGKLLGGALARIDTPEEQRPDFYLYIDEFQNFLTEGISIILSEARKYRLCLYIAHQFLGQLVKNNDTRIRDAIFGNIGSMMAYRIGVDDTEIMSKQFSPVFSEYDLLNVPTRTALVKMLIKGTEPPAFNIRILGKEKPKHPEIAPIIKELSRLKYGRDRNIVEAEIRERAFKEYV
jgi:hypothetical protein